MGQAVKLDVMAFKLAKQKTFAGPTGLGKGIGSQHVHHVSLDSVVELDGREQNAWKADFFGTFCGESGVAVVWPGLAAAIMANETEGFF